MSLVEKWDGRTVLVTGAGGFIGSHLTERLVSLGARTRALIRYNSANTWGWLDESTAKHDAEVLLGDVRDAETVAKAVLGVDTVFHLAALIAIPYSYDAPRSYVQTNVEGTLNVLQAARSAGVRLVVHTSTSEVYGTARYVPIDEDHALQGQSPYSASKIAADMMAEAFHHSFGLPVTTIRPFNTFGPRQSERAVIPTIIAQALTRHEIELGNLSPTRDFNYVLDTVEGFVRAAECPDAIGRVINIGTGKEISIGDLASTIANMVDRDVRVVCADERRRPEGSEVDRLCAASDRARELLGWQPRFSLVDGLAETIEWIEGHLDRFRGDRYVV